MRKITTLIVFVFVLLSLISVKAETTSSYVAFELEYNKDVFESVERYRAQFKDKNGNYVKEAGQFQYQVQDVWSFSAYVYSNYALDEDTFTEKLGIDIETGKAVYHKCNLGLEEDLLWFRASASMPLVSRIVEIDTLRLLDGGVADSVPVKFLESKGYEKNVVVLTQPKDFVKEKNSMLPFIKLKYKKYPNLVNAVANRHNIYNETTSYIKEKEEKGELFVIRPPENLNIKSICHDENELIRVYNIGRCEAEKRLSELKEYLA